MLTQNQIEGAVVQNDGTLTEIARASWETLIRGSALYHAKSGLYPDLTAKLAVVNGVKAKQMSAVLDRIDLLGDKVSSLKGYAGGVNSSTVEKRNALIEYGLSVLYLPPAPRPASSVVQMQSNVYTVCVWCRRGYYGGSCGCQNGNIYLT
ncbi:MAG: hypothetical protein ACR2LC_09670 [Pyrinomonadaceae bacterium]